MSVAFAWHLRWAKLLSVASALAFANSLVVPAFRGGSVLLDGPETELSKLFAGRAGDEGGFVAATVCGVDDSTGGARAADIVCDVVGVSVRFALLCDDAGGAAEQPLTNGGRDGAAR